MKYKKKDQRAWNSELISISQIDISGKNCQKRKHILITGLCNNNCLFCFSKRNLKIKNIPIKKIKKKLEEGILEGCKGLIISGGEATIHPNFIKIIELAKEKGYEYIEVITNGRMFSYFSFLKKAKIAGINSITFSIHGNKAKTHDYLTGVNGSYDQTIKAIEFAKKLKIQTKINIVLNKKNICELKEMVINFSEKGIKTIGLLELVPFGEAWKNRNKLFYNIKKYDKEIKEFLKEAKKRKISIWANRFNPKLYSIYPELSQDKSKLLNEIEARIFEFQESSKKNKPLYCYSKRCNFCFLKEFCKIFYKTNKIIYKKNKSLRLSPIKFVEYYTYEILPFLEDKKKNYFKKIEKDIFKITEKK